MLVFFFYVTLGVTMVTLYLSNSVLLRCSGAGVTMAGGTLHCRQQNAQGSGVNMVTDLKRNQFIIEIEPIKNSKG